MQNLSRKRWFSARTDGMMLAALLLSLAATALATYGWFAAATLTVPSQPAEASASPISGATPSSRWLPAGLVGHFLALTVLLASRLGAPLSVPIVALLRCTTVVLLAVFAVRWSQLGRVSPAEIACVGLQTVLWAVVETRRSTAVGSIGDWPSVWVGYGMAMALTVAGSAAWDRANALQVLPGGTVSSASAAVGPSDGNPRRDAKIAAAMAADVRAAPPEPADGIAAIADLPTAKNAAEAAVVRVVNRTQGMWGSGTIIAVEGRAAYVLTASHLLADDEEVLIEATKRRGFPAVAAWGDGDGRGSAELVLQDVANDLALLRVELRRTAAPPPQIPLCPLAEAPATDAVAAWAAFSDQEGRPHAAADTVTACRIRRRQGGDVLDMWEGNRAGRRGDSGGGLVDRQGRLIGVRSGMGDGKPYYCHLVAVHDFLARAVPLRAAMSKTRATPHDD